MEAIAGVEIGEHQGHAVVARGRRIAEHRPRRESDDQLGAVALTPGEIGQQRVAGAAGGLPEHDPMQAQRDAEEHFEARAGRAEQLVDIAEPIGLGHQQRGVDHDLDSDDPRVGEQLPELAAQRLGQRDRQRGGLRRLDLRGLDLRRLDLRGLDLRRLDLRRLDLRRLDLRGLDLRGLDLRGLAGFARLVARFTLATAARRRGPGIHPQPRFEPDHRLAVRRPAVDPGREDQEEHEHRTAEQEDQAQEHLQTMPRSTRRLGARGRPARAGWGRHALRGV
ncbi:pentapeptide repeat-containing protein [Nannocystaceae bacterium ST9]